MLEIPFLRNNFDETKLERFGLKLKHLTIIVTNQIHPVSQDNEP